MDLVIKYPFVKLEFARRLRQLREAKGLTPAEMAEILGVRRQTYAEWENETKSTAPSDKNMQIALCELLETTMDYLFRGLFEGQKESSHKKSYLDIYSRYKSDPDFNLLVRYLMQVDERVTVQLMSFIEALDCHYQGFPVIASKE